MGQYLNPSQQVHLLSSLNDNSISLGSAALKLSSMPNKAIGHYTGHLAELTDAVAAYYASIAGGDVITSANGGKCTHDINKKLRALQAVIFDQYCYQVNKDNYNELENSDLCSVIDRRKGMPIALMIICIDVAKAQGWNAEGLALPGHFVCRLEANGERIVFDPLNRARALDAAALRELVKQSLGEEAELTPESYQPISNHFILLLLQNNIRLRQVKKHDYPAALTSLNIMQQLAPQDKRLLLNAGQLHARANQPLAAINMLSAYLKESHSNYGRSKANLLLSKIKGKLL